MYFLSCVEIKTIIIIIIIIRKNGRARHARAEGAPSPLALTVLSCAHYFQAPALVEFDCLLFVTRAWGRRLIALRTLTNLVVLEADKKQ